MTTPTPDDRRVAEWAKNQLMEMGVEDPTTRTTPIVIDNATMNALLVNADRVRQLENELGEAKSALSTALRERESARQAISMADGTLVQIVAERDGLRETVTANKLTIDVLEASRDAWKAKAERTCKWSFAALYAETECGKQNVQPWIYDPQFGYVMCPCCGGRIVKEEE